MSSIKTCPKCGLEVEGDSLYCPRDGTSLGAARAEHSLVGQVVADRYRVLKQLGHGGMGDVYLAEHTRMSRRCALKFIRGPAVASRDALLRFNREATNASRISHPNVVQVYDFGETADGMSFLAMEYVEGTTLSAVLASEGVIPPFRTVQIATQVGDALGAAHDLGIVHRDLKPENVMLAKHRDGSDFVKVVDFGVSRAMEAPEQRVTETGVLVGTIDYMSPEQFLFAELDGRSDIYSFGILVFRMLTGKLPLTALSAYEAREQRMSGRPLRLAEVRPGLDWPEKLQQVLDQAMARAPRDRYDSAVRFASDLQVVINEWLSQPTAAAPLLEGENPLVKTAGGPKPLKPTIFAETPTAGSAPGSLLGLPTAAPAPPAPVAVSPPPLPALAPASASQGAVKSPGTDRQPSGWMALFTLGGKRFRFEIRVAFAAAAVLLLTLVIARPWQRDPIALASNTPPTTVSPPVGTPLDSAATVKADSLVAAKPPLADSGRTASTSAPPGRKDASSTRQVESERVIRALARAEQLTAETATDAQAREALGILRDLRPVTRAARVEALYRQFEANFRLDQTAEACRLYRQLVKDAPGTRFEASIGFFAPIAKQECARD